MGKKSSPKPPDYAAAAEKTATADKQTLEQQTWGNRPTQNTPWGTSDWQNAPQWDPTTNQYINQWENRITLSPSEQAAFDAQQAVKVTKSLQGMDMMGRIKDEFGNPMDWSSAREGGDRVEGGVLQGSIGDPADVMRQNAEDAIYGKATSRLDPRFAREDEDLKASLYNQGLRPGDEAYKRAMAEQGETKNDAYDQATMSSIMGGGQEMSRDFGIMAGQGQFANQATEGQLGMDINEGGYNTTLRQQDIAELAQQRGWSLNEINAILEGQQVQMPQMPDFKAAGKAKGTDYSGAARDQFSAEMDAFGADQALTQGILSAGGSAMSMSDRRVKRNIKLIGSTPGGTNIYSYQYIWSDMPQIGVMADEVPHATVMLPTGIAMVDYSKVI